ncbi:hypothetical protein NDU88_006782 [Pleurodeles waltl]|uniref:Uncharacterized protein n=1 Tax=Pleurodeles waltl TaxID=8319 RepID=A0AAV7N1F8_PLEWA|nr:hypothetical protein NDU88_006782 [Pleurodeles waltl]
MRGRRWARDPPEKVLTPGGAPAYCRDHQQRGPAGRGEMALGCCTAVPGACGSIPCWAHWDFEWEGLLLRIDLSPHAGLRDRKREGPDTCRSTRTEALDLQDYAPLLDCVGCRDAQGPSWQGRTNIGGKRLPQHAHP